MEIRFSNEGFEDLNYWKKNNPQMVNRIKKLLENILESPYEGIGKPEPLKYGLSGFWSRRINQEHKLVYRVKDEIIEVISCRYHYR
ncbi:MAG: Txe/YoeB family addiction module toxin [Tissierellia bacterium]|nr:Txe/YoeB family addiction module toxin [Tissierellia bacterium]